MSTTTRMARVNPKKPLWLDKGWQPYMIAYCETEEAFKSVHRACGAEYRPWPIVDGTIGNCRVVQGFKFAAIVIAVDADRELPEVIGTIVHEAVHAWQYICEYIGEDAPGWETEAYSIQHITQQIVEQYIKGGVARDEAPHSRTPAPR